MRVWFIVVFIKSYGADTAETSIAYPPTFSMFISVAKQHQSGLPVRAGDGDSRHLYSSLPLSSKPKPLSYKLKKLSSRR